MLLFLLLLILVFATGGFVVHPVFWLVLLILILAYIMNGPRHPTNRRWW